MASKRVALWVWYRGDRFRGFQTQPKGPTVQQALQEALLQAGVSAPVHPSGRTDRGVHARMQVVSFRAPEGAAEGLGEILRRRLPEGLGVCVAREVMEAFHAQWRAVVKEYRYRLALRPPDPRWRGACWQVAEDLRSERPIAPERFASLLGRCVGARDFWAFHAKSSPRKVRRLFSAEVREIEPGLLEARLWGDSFARYQVRYLVGSSAMAAAGLLSEQQLEAALEEAAEIRGFRAPGSGLTLWEVHYPPELDPFTREERRSPPHLPRAPPFIAPEE